MTRLDPEYKTLTEKLSHLDENDAEYVATQNLLDDREKLLFPIYSQIALQFADLHDTPGRMKAKDAIDGILDWPQSRQFLYYRLRKRLIE